MRIPRPRRISKLMAPALAAALAITGMVAPTVEAGRSNNVKVYEIQGEGHISPLVGEQVRVRAAVTAKAFDGFYMQDRWGDRNPLTSDGIFVSTFNSDFDLDDIVVGRTVRVDGTVSEFIPGGASSGNLSVTQIVEAEVESYRCWLCWLWYWLWDNPVKPVVIGEGGFIAPNVDVISTDELPVNLQNEPGQYDPAHDAIDFYEAAEGMLVTVDAPVVVGATRRFSPFSAELFALPSGGSAAIIEPDDARTGRGGIALQPDLQNLGDQNPERIQIQFDPTISGGAPVPLIPVGAQLDDVTGVVGYSFGNFEVNATHEVTFSGSGPAPETTTLVGSENELTVASYNVLNLDPNPLDDPFEDDAAQFAAVAGHIVDNLGAPDIVALQEIQDDSGEVADGTLSADTYAGPPAAAIASISVDSVRSADSVPSAPSSSTPPR